MHSDQRAYGRFVDLAQEDFVRDVLDCEKQPKNRNMEEPFKL